MPYVVNASFHHKQYYKVTQLWLCGAFVNVSCMNSLFQKSPAGLSLALRSCEELAQKEGPLENTENISFMQIFKPLRFILCSL